MKQSIGHELIACQRTGAPDIIQRLELPIPALAHEGGRKGQVYSRSPGSQRTSTPSRVLLTERAANSARSRSDLGVAG